MKTQVGSTPYLLFFFFNDTATTEIYTLSLHDALPISGGRERRSGCNLYAHGSRGCCGDARLRTPGGGAFRDRKSTRLNSSHGYISYAVFCLKKKKNARRCYTAASTDSHGRCRRPLKSK